MKKRTRAGGFKQSFIMREHKGVAFIREVGAISRGPQLRTGSLIFILLGAYFFTFFKRDLATLVGR